MQTMYKSSIAKMNDIRKVLFEIRQISKWNDWRLANSEIWQGPRV